MKILLTGSEGFIGKNLTQYLKDKHQIIPLDKITGDDLVTCNLDYDVDMVIHLAGLSGVRQSLDNPVDYWTNNVVGSYRIFNKFKDKKILYASSSTAKEPWRNPYAMSKFYMEQIAPDNATITYNSMYCTVLNTDKVGDKNAIQDMQDEIETLYKTDLDKEMLNGLNENDKIRASSI